MKKILSFLVVAALVVSCSKTDEVQPSSYIITGHATTASTRLYTAMLDELPGYGKIYSFWWSDGDMIWVGSQQSDLQQSDPLTESSIYGGDADFALPRAPQSGAQVIYNMKANTSAKASTADVPAEQDASKSLGENGAFGQTELDGTWFSLEYKTNFVTFNIQALPSGATLKSIRLDAGDAIVAGSAAWSSTDGWGEVSNGSSTIELKVNKSTVSSTDYITMVILPPADMTIPSAKITYELEIEGVKKYYTQPLGSKTFTTGELARVSVALSAVDLYELRTLTFEGDYWDAKIPSTAYGNGNNTYSWYDEHTELTYDKDSDYFCGQAGISNYTGSDLTLPVANYYNIDLQAYNVTGGANGSENFCVHFGYLDDSGYSMASCLKGFEFDDGNARVIDHMYVTNTTYVYHTLAVGDQWMVPDGGVPNDCWVRIIAYGYDDKNDPDDSPDSQTEFYLLKEGRNFVTDWTKWDLSVLGKVAKVKFNMDGSPYCYEDHLGGNPALGFLVPAYFAFDDVVVRF